MRAAPVPGMVIGAVKNHETAWIAPLGILAAGTDNPVTPASVFHAASLTKQVVVYAAFALRDQGKLDFDRPLVAYVDDLPNAVARRVTVRQVLSHSSGFVNWRFAKASEPVPELVP